MSAAEGGANRPTLVRAHLRPALLWALLHTPLALFFFRGALGRSLEAVPAGVHLPLIAGFAVQAAFVTFVAWLATLPLLVLGRRYAWAAPVLIGLASVFLFVDSLLFDSLGFHFNRLFLSVALQPGALAETGLPAGEVALLALAAVLFVGAEAWAGSRFLRRFAGTGRTWPWALAIVLLWTGERVTNAALTFTTGQAVLAAGSTLPLQPPVRMNTALRKLTGRQPVAELSLGAMPQAGTPIGAVEPGDIHFTRKPDVIFVLIESLRSDFFQPDVMPNTWRRAEQGAVFTRHYSGASSTHYSLFTLFFGLDTQRRDATIGAGRSPLLFPALKANGYESKLLAASSVDWMGLKESVFRDIPADSLLTDFTGEGFLRDRAMIAKAKEVIAATPAEKPLFLFVFFDGTHFNYSYTQTSEKFTPAWNGKGSFMTTDVDAELLKNRAKNAAWEVDKKIESLLSFLEQTRGGKPLVVITSDHGEEFKEHGRVGHASDVTAEQLHVPMIVLDEGLAPGRRDSVTGHVDLIPTLLSRLGDGHDPASYSDGIPMDEPRTDRFVLASVGWEPRYALIGQDLKVRFFGQDAGLGAVKVTDPQDEPLPDGQERFSKNAPRLLETLRGRLGRTTAAR